MIRILHCADLHLSADEADYCLAVLDEITALAESNRCAWILFAGDIFDTYPDLERLKGDFRKRMASLPQGCRALVIAGNHDRLRMGANRLSAVDLGPAAFVADSSYELFPGDDVELLAVPFASSHADYVEWKLPPRKAPLRIAVAHGSIAGMHYAGGDEEEEAGVMDPDLFVRHGVQLAALGHIHAGRTEVIEGVIFSYPGSARVWRRGETGQRFANLIETGKSPRLLQVPIAAAGQYRRYEYPLNLDGSLPPLGALAEEWGRTDWVEIAVSGVIEDERVLAASEAELKRRHGGRVRRLEVTREGVLTLEGIATQPVAKRFLELWKGREPSGSEERSVWLKARELALVKIKVLLEARR